ncbi:MAG: flagellar biosynthesis protein [Pelotomaculum sp.]|uniref:Flagellar biosynthesis/type III secretory pathway protein n=1 Tax=Pelotomaculum thermopropionicum (strain DSM 13744 / JCM 10971 / SI) TaxID=370438 RepID=A5D0F5_PELTS|nr:flagellar biosynthesis protein [Pelotomaculum sp.]BAF60268.1 flagellar biosynthesis/type III secretory pathway protein [Pelotomaculum thermopropionicum SI]
MSFSYRIIKGAALRDGSMQVLPLREHLAWGKTDGAGGGNGSDGGEADNLLAKFKEQAEEIISQARARAGEIIDRARLESEEIKREAYQSAFDRGYREGRDKGYQEGMLKAGEEAASIRAQALEVLKQAEQIRRRTLESMEQEVVTLARDIAEKLLSAQLAIAPETVLNVAGEALRLVAGRTSVALFVSPAEVELVEGKKGDLLSLLPPGAELLVVADPAVHPGGCRVETELGSVDATLERRKEELIRALYGR